MENNNLNELKKELEIKVELAFENTFPDIQLIKDVLSIIYKIEPNKGKDLELFHKLLGDRLFERGVKLQEYNKDYFTNPLPLLSHISSIPAIVYKDDLEEKLLDLRNCIKNEINNIRRFIFLTFGDNKTGSTKILLLHDTHSKISSFEKLKIKFNANCLSSEIDDFLKELKNGSKYSNEKYLALCVFSQTPDFSNINEIINQINGTFGKVVQLKIVEVEGDDLKIIREDNPNEIIEEIKYLVGIDISNKDLTPSEEKIVKKMFKDAYIHTLEYEVLHSGFSGSKVIKVKPFKNAGEATKYVIKIGNINNERIKSKINQETINFNKYVGDLDSSYRIQPEKTENHIAIKYNYASNDGKMDSDSFSERFKLYVLKGESKFDLNDSILKLFDINIFKNWNTPPLKTQKQSIESLYSKFVNPEEIFKVVAKIKNIEESNIESDELIRIFKKIYSHQLNVYTKICHGDLHTENFFIDDDGKIFLIDFGDTEFHHSLIDHTTLECSLKYRHVPFYIDVNELIKLEEELLNISSFESTFKFKNSIRSDLKLQFDLIKNIRVNSLPLILDDINKLDYFISLFMITFRQIRYNGLNQLYALKSAEIIGQHITKLI